MHPVKLMAEDFVAGICEEAKDLEAGVFQRPNGRCFAGSGYALEKHLKALDWAGQSTRPSLKIRIWLMICLSLEACSARREPSSPWPTSGARRPSVFSTRSTTIGLSLSPSSMTSFSTCSSCPPRTLTRAVMVPGDGGWLEVVDVPALGSSYFA